MKSKRKKRPVTLIEIMIVILLIGFIGGALAFNMRGSMDKGRVFKTEQNISRVYDAMMFEYAKGERTLDEIVEDKKNVMNTCPFVKNGEKMLVDAWGIPLHIVVDKQKDDLEVTSTKMPTNQTNG
jgi:type II secretory pathway pseudopilin PulG